MVSIVLFQTILLLIPIIVFVHIVPIKIRMMMNGHWVEHFSMYSMNVFIHWIDILWNEKESIIESYFVGILLHSFSSTIHE